jgi:hypothetical protein
MHNNNMYCPVCGLEQNEPPWGDDGKNPSFDICDCCGVEFGYEDSTPESIESYRKKWIAEGAKWKRKPENWNLEKQLNNIRKDCP